MAAEFIDPSWNTKDYLSSVLYILDAYRRWGNITALQAKWALWEWCQEVGLECKGEWIEIVTGQPAGTL